MEKIKEFAYHIVNKSLKIKKNDVVSINADLLYEEDTFLLLSLIEELAMNIRSRMAFPFFDFTISKLKTRFFDLPKKVIKNRPNYYIENLKNVDVFIDLRWKTDPGFVYEIDSEKYELYQKTMSPISKIIHDDSKRILLLSFPSKKTAKFFNINYNLLNKSYFSLFDSQKSKIKNNFNRVMKKLDKNSGIIETEKGKIELDLNNFLFENYYFSKEIPVISYPFGYIIFPVKKIEGVLESQYINWENQFWQNVGIEFQYNKIYQIDSVNDEFTIYKLFNSFRESPFCLIGLNSLIEERIGYFPFDSKAKGQVSLIWGLSYKKMYQFHFQSSIDMLLTDSF